MRRIKFPLALCAALVLAACGDPFIGTSGSADVQSETDILDCARFPSRC